ncbi:MAG: hypothetical protein HOV70_33085 [Streptomyces sp.]|nr:hypothetical protein [Streptomyces sp.]
MNESLTLDDLAVPLRMLRLLTVDFGHLTAPTVQVGTIWPDLVQLSFHGGLAGFEEWREALGIAPDAVTHRTQSAGRTRVLLASGEFAGATVKLVAYSEVPALALTEAAA